MKKLTINGVDGIKIPALITEPSGQVNSTVILSHGISTSKAEYLNFFLSLHKLIADSDTRVISFDYRGHGDSKLQPKEFTIASQVIDLLSVVDWAKSQNKTTSITLAGCSFGAPPCILLDNLEVVDIEKIVCIAPVLDYRRTFLTGEATWGKDTFPKSVQFGAMRGTNVFLSDDFYITGQLFVEMEAIDISNKIAKSSSKMLVIHGAVDDMVSPNISVDISARFDVPMIMLDDTEHGFTHAGDEIGDHPKTLQNLTLIAAKIKETA